MYINDPLLLLLMQEQRDRLERDRDRPTGGAPNGAGTPALAPSSLVE